MIDPKSITDFNASDEKLEELALFWVLAAGKNGVIAAKNLDCFLTAERLQYGNLTPFELIRKMVAEKRNIALTLRDFGIGCYGVKAESFKQLANSGLNLRTCTTDDLENIFGIGCKSSRCFVIHTRPNQKLAGLDTHILKFLRDQGYNVPASTPSSKSQYLKIEQFFLAEVEKSGKTVAELDLEIWNQYREK
jgi:thermostable 8-oxoguanine DNA glycosylase